MIAGRRRGRIVGAIRALAGAPRRRHNNAMVTTRTWLLVLLAAALGIMLYPRLQDWAIAAQAEPRQVTSRGVLTADEQSTIEIFERISPSVVFITTLERRVDFWTRNVLEVPRGTGSGFVWDDNGHVVSNYHVVEGAERARVHLNDGRVFEAALVGFSVEHDLAVLRISVGTRQPVPIPIGTSADLRVGQKVLAIGNPFGLDYTLTTGIISALDRSISAGRGRQIEHLIQTDAAINPGNSGGPLIDSAGRLIGINTAIFSPSGAYAGIGFAVPVDTVNWVVPRLIAHGRYIRPALGIRIDDDISARITAQLGIEGVAVLRVDPGSGAERAGLRGVRVLRDGRVIPGDVIVAVAGREIRDSSDLLDALERHELGDRVTVDFVRDGERTQVTVTLTGS